MVKDYVTCHICGANIKQLNDWHLKGNLCQQAQHKQNINVTTIKEYRLLFPNAQVTSDKLILRMKTNNPMKKPGIPQKLWKRRRENDPDNMSFKQGIKTRHKNDPNGECYKRGQLTRKTNDPTNEWAKRIWEKRKINDPNDEWTKRMIDTRHKNNPNNECYKKTVDTRTRLYGYMGVRNPNPRATKLLLGRKIWWENLTPEEKMSFLKKGFFSGNKKPNISESKILNFIQPLGFRYNGRGPVIINNHTPDFNHIHFPLLIEFDGGGGHDPNNPRVPSNIAELDDIRDADYKMAEKEILRLLPEDLKKGQLFTQQKVKEWMISLGYPINWELFDVREWFE